MDTVETREQTPPPAGTLYDGFISYSHAADDLLAPRLQGGLQRFAKPWWKRRALRIFRDESSLSANPHLWSSITDALDTSDWFVLLLSPDAAESEWVNQEVEYWLEHKDPGRIIPVVTDGEFTWSETDIDLESTAAPPALYGAFSDEPRWVDLRFARSEEQLDLNNPRFSAAVADIASAIRQVPKEELESEEVRQHRRTVRTAWGAGIVVLLLALLAGAAALFAVDQRNDAQQSQAEAEAAAAAEAEARADADENAAEADRQREQAEANAAEAEQQAEVAKARELTLEAEKALASDPELSIHLALRALASFRDTGEDRAQAVSALRAGIAADRVVWRVPGGDFVAVHPDGSLLATGDGDDVAVWNIGAHEVVERYEREGDFAVGADFSPDGGLLAVYFLSDGPPVSIWDRTTGESFVLGEGSSYDYLRPVFSPDGEFLAFVTARGLGPWLQVWSVADRRLVYEDKSGFGPDFNPEGVLSYAWESADRSEWGIRLVDPVTWRVVDTFDTIEPSHSAWSPDGTQIAVSGGNATGTIVLDVSTGATVAHTEAFGRPEWLPDGDAFVVADLLGSETPRVIDAVTGEIRTELHGLGEGIGTTDYQVVPGTSLLASAAAGPNRVRAGDTVLFETSPLGGVEVGGWEASLPLPLVHRASFTGDGSRIYVSDGDAYLTADAVDGDDAHLIVGGDSGPTAEAWWPDPNAPGTFTPSLDLDGRWYIRSTATDEVIYEAPPGTSIHAVSWDGTRAVINARPDLALFALPEECGLAQVVSTADGSVIAELWSEGCAFRAFFSPDAELVYAFNFDGGSGVFDTETGELLVDVTDSKYNGLAAGFSPDGTDLIVGLNRLYVLDVAMLRSGASIDEAVRLELPGHESLVLRVAVSPDGSMAATGSPNEPLKLWNLTTGRRIAEFGGVTPFAHDGAFHPTRPWLMVAISPNQIRIHTLDLDELVAIAETRLSRPMTEEECQQYFREPCSAS